MNFRHTIFQLFCQKNELFWSEICNSWNISDYCTPMNNNFKNNDLGHLNVSLFFSTTTDQVI